MHPRTLLGVLDHIMSVEVDYNARFLAKGYGRTELEEESRERSARAYSICFSIVIHKQ